MTQISMYCRAAQVSKWVGNGEAKWLSNDAALTGSAVSDDGLQHSQGHPVALKA